MKNMFTLISILILLGSCEKEVQKSPSITGEWQLEQTELYVNDTLSGTSAYEEITTTYAFEDCTAADGTCSMSIIEDGNFETYTYTYDDQSGSLVLNGSTNYLVELSNSTMTLSQEYGENRSIWLFSKKI